MAVGLVEIFNFMMVLVLLATMLLPTVVSEESSSCLKI